MHQSDMSINVDMLDTNSIGSFDDEILATPPRNITPVPVTPLTKSQKRSAKKKARKEKQKLQLQTPSQPDEQAVPTFSTESSEYTLSKPSSSRTVTFNQSTLSSPSILCKQQLKRDSKPQSTPIDNGKKLKQKETDNTLRNGNIIITGYVPQDQEQAQMLDLVVYDIPAKWDNYTLLANLGRWVLEMLQWRDWTVNLGGIPVIWFPASWNLSERKQREKFQAVVYNLPDDMTDASLFPNGRPHQFLLDSGIKSFKIVKEVNGSRKLIGYFDTWDHVSTRINNPQLWNDVRISWCRYSTPNFKNLRRFAQIGKVDKSSRTPKGSNSSFLGFNTNNRKNDQNKTPKSKHSSKKIDHSRMNQSKKPDIKHLITGLKALLEHYV
ncbi:hypothetical protein RclHR1_37440001 [Rhizophagus clarus]|uniref:Uncharacterized protein n=1 Tax=Rhizophagus clarus TaxID=94130 RepID=A0A2Z6RPE3_9GLOM|nr:hypothetical protein RclHR1_37440001 [Rhizophagus clarus]